jgi:DnaB-like helicase C terminal domain.
MHYGLMLLSKVIDNNDVAALARFGITESDFATEAERKAYRFIVDYAEANRGQAPSYATVAAEVDGFTYIPEVADSYEYLARQIKSYAAKMAAVELLQNQAPKVFEEKDGNSFIEWLISEAERIKIRTGVRNKIGTDVKADVDKFLAEYERRKAGESFRVWKSRFPFINEAIGGYVSGNLYVVYGRSGRGKSAITLEECIEMAMQGATVLIWSMEMGWYEVMVRIYTSVSGRIGVSVAELDGIDMEAGFDSRDLRHGKLSPDFEKKFQEFLASINAIIPGRLIVRAVDDEDFVRRDLRQLEADIIETKADVVIIDPFYYLDYEKNTSRTAGGDAAETSKKLRRLAGRTKAVVFAITQADEVDGKEDDDGERELRLPERSEVKKTKQLLEDAALLIAVDTNAKQGRGLIGINKGRDGGEGEQAEILYLPQIGVIREMETDEAAAAQFANVFEFLPALKIFDR